MIGLVIVIEIIVLIMLGICWYQAEENCSDLGMLGTFLFRSNVNFCTTTFWRITWIYKLYT